MFKCLQIICTKYYDPGYMFLKDCTSSKLACLLDTASKFALLTVSGLKDEKLIKGKPACKVKHTSSILESFEYFC